VVLWGKSFTVIVVPESISDNPLQEKTLNVLGWGVRKVAKRQPTMVPQEEEITFTFANSTLAFNMRYLVPNPQIFENDGGGRGLTRQAGIVHELTRAPFAEEIACITKRKEMAGNAKKRARPGDLCIEGVDTVGGMDDDKKALRHMLK